MRVNKKLKNLISQLRGRTAFFTLCLLILNTFLIQNIFETHGISHPKAFTFLFTLSESVCIFIVYLLSKKHFSPEKSFLVLSIILGALFITLLPVGQAPDELNHFRRAYSISHGKLLADVIDEEKHGGTSLAENIPDVIGSSLPEVDRYKTISENFTQPFSDETSVQSFTNTAIYNPICYFPQVLAGLVGRLFNLPILPTAYLMRMFNFLVYVLLIYFAIKKAPRFKKIILFIALNPMSLQEATSLAPDAITNSLAIFIIAFVCYLAYEKSSQITKREYVLLYLSAIVIGLCKIVYLPLICLYFLIPYKRFSSKKQCKYIHASIIACLVLIINFSWLFLSSRFLGEFQPGVDSAEQVAFILHNPLKYLSSIIITTSTYGEAWLDGVLGLSLGAFVFDYPFIYNIIALVMFILVFVQRDERLPMKKGQNLFILFLFLMLYVLVCTSVYVQWTAVGAQLIDGVQGRYFIAILLLIPLSLNRTTDKSPHMQLITRNTILSYSVFASFIAFALFFAQNI